MTLNSCYAPSSCMRLAHLFLVCMELFGTVKGMGGCGEVVFPLGQGRVTMVPVQSLITVNPSTHMRPQPSTHTDTCGLNFLLHCDTN